MNTVYVIMNYQLTIYGYTTDEDKAKEYCADKNCFYLPVKELEG